MLLRLCSVFLFALLISYSKGDESASNHLPGTTIPLEYDIKLTIDPTDTSYFGDVTIKGKVEMETDKIVLHSSNDTDFSSISVKVGSDNVFKDKIYHDDDSNFLEIQLKQKIHIGELFTLKFEFKSPYLEDYGITVDNYIDKKSTEKRYIVFSYFHPFSPRKAFPCYDEPKLKAQFTIAVYHPVKYVVLSNMNEDKGAIPSPKKDYKCTVFSKSPKMTLNLVSFVVSEFEYITNEYDSKIYSKPMRIYSRPEMKEYLNFALDVAQKTMVFLESYLNKTYLLPKLDIVVVPKLNVSSSDNWGLIIWDEEDVVLKSDTKTKDKKEIGENVIHEVVHMFFGDEVTISSWKYIWMKEGLARFLEFFIADKILDKNLFDIDYVVVEETEKIMEYDVESSISPKKYTTQSEVQEIIQDSLNIFQKPSSLFYMIYHALGEKQFKSSLEKFLKKNSLKSVTPVELFDEFQNAMENLLPSDFKMHDVMNTWVENIGFPVVYARRNDKKNSITISQQPQTLDDNETIKSKWNPWYIPLTWTTKSNIEFQNTFTQKWLKPNSEIELQLEKSDDWFIINKQNIGLYRVFYETSDWIKLAAVLKSKDFGGIHRLNRAELMDDSYTFADHYLMSFNETFNILSYLENEDDYVPWITAKRAIDNLYDRIRGTEIHELFQKFTWKLVKNIYKKLGNEPKPTDNDKMRLLRVIALDLACKSDYDVVLKDMNDKLNRIIEIPDSNSKNLGLDPDLAEIICKCGMRRADEKLWNRVLTSSLASDSELRMHCLAAIEDKSILKTYLEMIMVRSNQNETQKATKALEYFLPASTNSIEVILDYIINSYTNEATLNKVFTVDIIDTISREVTTRQQQTKFLNVLKNFKYTGDSDADRKILKTARQNCVNNLDWMDGLINDIQPWLNEYLNENRT